MQKRLSVLAEVVQKFDHVIEVSFAGDSVFDVIRVRQHFVLSACVLQDFSLFRAVHESCIEVERDGFLVPEAGQDRLIRGLGRVFLDCPYTAVTVTADVVIHIEFDRRGDDHVEEVFDIGFAMSHFFG